MKRFLCSLLLFVLNVLCVGSSFGYDDCSLVNTEYAGQGFKLVDLRKDNTDETLKNSTVTPDDVITMHNTVIDTASLTTALLNQRKKCCEVNTTMNPIRCKNDAQYFNLNVPDSTFLFDHLLDVMLRRLDGENLYDGTIPDGSGAERRKLMDEIGGNITGTIPDAIKKPYETFRTVKADHLFQGGFSQVTTEDRAYYLATMRTGKNANIIRNYPGWTLGEKYRNTCDIAGYIYFRLNRMANSNDPNSSIEITKGRMTDPKLLSKPGCKNACTCLVENRIGAENTYVQNIITQQSTKFLVKNINEYLNVYLNKRLLDFQSLLQNINTSTLRVVKGVEKLTNICS